MALTKVTYSMIQDAAVNVQDYGASSSATAAENLAAFKLAVTATPTGGTLFVPADAAEYVIDTNGGESAAIDINKRMTVWIDGVVKSNFGAIQANPPTIFLVTADYVSFTGNGIVEGDGVADQTNTGADATLPSLIKVTGDYFSMTGLTINKPYKIGLFLFGSLNSTITNNHFTGGPTEYLDTAYFGIRSYLGGRHIFSNNQFYPGADGGMYVQCMFASGANECIYEGNFAYRPFEKLVYLSSSDNLVSDNVVIGNSGIIPGTNSAGTLTSVYRADGSRNKITNNYSRYGGGASIAAGGANEISNNSFFDAGQSGISVFAATGVALLDYTTVRGNVITCGNMSGVYVQDGILVAAPSGTNRYIDISDNTITGFAKVDPAINVVTWTTGYAAKRFGLIRSTTSIPNTMFRVVTPGVTGLTEPVWPTVDGVTVTDGTVVWVCVVYDPTQLSQIRVLAPSAGNDRCVISNNNMDDGKSGIYTTYMTNSTISNNRINASVWGISQLDGTFNKYRFNTVEGALNVGIEYLDANSRGEGNTYSGTDVIATITLPSAVSTYTIPTSSGLVVAPNAKVLLTATNASAALLVAGNGIYATVTSPNAILTSGNGSNFAGTEQFIIQIIQ